METFDEHNKIVRPHHKFKTMLVGILVVTFGLLYMMHNMGMIDPSVWRIIFSWPMLLVALGVVNLAERNFSWGFLLMAVGGVFLIDRYYDLPYNIFTFFWPIVIIAIGLGLIFSNSCKMLRIKRNRPDFISTEGDQINEQAIFGGSERAIHSNNFRGGEIVAIFGGTKTDLTQCQLAPGDNVLELTAIFGGTTLIVPNDWNIKVEMTNIFGGFSDKRRNMNVDYNKTLIIKGAAIFGGGELKSY
jgi:predicted membrane protein